MDLVVMVAVTIDVATMIAAATLLLLITENVTKNVIREIETYVVTKNIIIYFLIYKLNLIIKITETLASFVKVSYLISQAD